MTEETFSAGTCESVGRSAFFESVKRVTIANRFAPFDLDSEKLLGQFPLEIRLELIKALRHTASTADSADPASYAQGSRLIALTFILAGYLVCVKCSASIEAVRDLSKSEAIAAVETSLATRWAPRTIGLYFGLIHRFCHILYKDCNPQIAYRRDHYASGEKRDLSARTFAAEEYRRGALAISRVATLLDQGHKRRAVRWQRGAALLGFASFAHARRSEYIGLNVGHIRKRYLVGGEVCLSVELIMRKTHNDRLVIVRNQDIIDLLEPLLDGPGSLPLFRKRDGSRCNWREFAKLFEDFGVLAVGQPASSNILRSSSTLGRKTRRKRASLVGHREGSLVAEEVYARSDSSWNAGDAESK